MSLDLITWARKRPYWLWVVKWPLAAIGLIVIWVVGPLVAGFESARDGHRMRQFPGAK